MQLDIERYRQFVDHFDISDERKIELIHIVGQIMESFIDRAFGESPEQILLGTSLFQPDGSAPDGVESDNHLQSQFNSAADEVAARKSRP